MDQFKYNQKDIEIPLLFSYLRSYPEKINSTLVIGLEDATYLKRLKDLSKRVMGISQIVSEEDKKHLDEYYNESLFLLDPEPADFLISLSYLNKVGVVEAENHLFEFYQLEYYQKMLDLFKKGFFVSFIYGQPNLYKNTYNVIHREMLDKMLKITPKKGLDVQFIASGNTEKVNSWEEIPQKVADTFYSDPYSKEKAICLIQIQK